MSEQLSEVEQSDLEYVCGLTEPLVPHTLDLSDERQHRYLTNHLARVGCCEKEYPQLFKSLSEMKDCHADPAEPVEKTLLQLDAAPSDMWISTNMITCLGSEDDNLTFVGRAFSGYTGNTALSQLTMQLQDITTGVPVASAAPPAVVGGGTFLDIEVTGALAAVGNGCLATYVAVITPGEDDALLNHTAGKSLAQVTYSRDSRQDPTQKPTVTAPVRNASHQTRDYIKVALNRNSSQQPDADYWYQTGSGGGTTPIVGVGAAGNAVWDSAITAPSYPSSFNGSLVLISRTGGGSVQLNGDQMVAGVSIDGGNPNQLNWNYDPALLQNAPWAQGDTIDFFQTIMVKTVNSGADWNTIQVLSTGCLASDMACAPVYPLQFVWGCLAENTLVRMANGSVKCIQDVEAGDRVLSDSDGRTLSVRDTIYGFEEKPLLLVKSAQGDQVLSTDGHPFVTGDGVKLAKTLVVGETVLCAQGPSTIASIEEIDRPCNVYNLVLGDGDELDTLVDDNSTHFAGGFLVGDDRMQSIYSDLAKAEKENIDPLSWLPKKWHQDYHNAEKARSTLAKKI